MYPFSINAEAEASIMARAEELARQSGSRDLGYRFLSAVDDTIDAIRANPTARPLSIYRPRGDVHTRHLSVEGFRNDVLFYEFNDRRVRIHHLFHAAMDLPRRLAD